jgi:hypothetical protein
MQSVWILYSLIIQGEPPSKAVDVGPAKSQEETAVNDGVVSAKCNISIESR